jgi:hypothetical protein
MSHTKEIKSYEDLVAESGLVEKIISPEMAEAVFASSEGTVKNLIPLWKENTRKNLDLYKKHGSLRSAFNGFCTDKAIIAVGAGQSFLKNKEVLKEIYRINLNYTLDKQPFFIVSSNKMLKPLLEIGIFPHATILIDAGDALYPQLCDDMPAWARNSILITGMHTSHKILKKWDKHGGLISFFMIGDDDEKKWFEEATGEDADGVWTSQGGNVMNTLWILANRVFKTQVFIMVGNDLCFKYSDDKEERAKSFYADGDYRLNILNKRDEAKDNFGWMGFNLKPSVIQPSRLMVDLELVGMSRQLWLYKTWLEVQSTVLCNKHKFHIFNASEAGVCGMIARKHDSASMATKENWFLLDDVHKKWTTTTLAKACQTYLEARALCQTRTDARRAGSWEGTTGTANVIDPCSQLRNSTGLIHAM